MRVMAYAYLARNATAHAIAGLRLAHQSFAASISARTFASATCGRIIASCPVQPAPSSIADSPQAFLRYALSQQSAPLHFTSSRDQQPTPQRSRAEELIQNMRQSEDRLVEIELGRYDRAASGTFDRVPVCLGQYLDWLESAERSDGLIAGQQVYLAQWRGSDEVPALASIVTPPPLLNDLLETRCVDLYQRSFFIGPTSAVTPLHYDPYMNLYHLEASSNPLSCAKHFLLIPPSAAEFVKRADDFSALRNTSSLDFSLCRRHSAHYKCAFDIVASSTVPERSSEVLSSVALSCILREGETLFIPKRWWHRVENVSLLDEASEGSARSIAGWTAGIGWWFLPRESPQRSYNITENTGPGLG
ncbi:Clavaminate synthase-like protein [Wolfiporia cocos MD-104 SS10]|uniref:Clavaminate synthase-like protein n=1 Tax=Wolfiporia cocos (strain MD-104) TaxID=742152 RepID=A0A2H3JH82_WOLCO|nr:Clavaminate synthase-like protein [Wolfiporia cocos MD-104 SS10]